jgi:glycosyltransferase involved in cell wall biosynthesis
MFHTLRALAAVGPVDLVCRLQHPDFDLDLEPLKRLCRSIRTLDPLPGSDPPEPRTRGEVLQRFILARRPMRFALYPDEGLAPAIEPLARSADLIWMVRLDLAEWMPRHRDRIIVDIDDFESVKRAQVLPPLGLRPWPWLLRLENRKLARLERKAPRRYAGCVVCSDAQRRFFPRRLRRRVLVAPNGFPSRLLSLPLRPSDGQTIVFVGNMDYRPNVDSVSWFAKEVFPTVRRRVPGARLLLVGHDHHQRLLPLVDGERIVATGSVDDVAPHVASASVSVAPILVGSGTRLKILEALALGVPVVSTTLGAEGLNLTPGRDILLADHPGEFADAVARLLSDPAARAALGEAGRAAVTHAYSWEAIEQRLTDDVRAWLAARR